MSSKSRKIAKVKMFERCASATSRILSTVIDCPAGIICPLCTHYISDVDLITDEHVPQKSVGGRILCLTCRNCNSRAGNQFEYALSNEHLAINPFTENPVRGHWSFSGVKVRGDISYKNGTFHLVTIENINNPKSLLSAEERILGMGSKKQVMTVSVDTKYSEHHADIAYLKSAYLALFSKFGYNLVLRNPYDIIRKQIADPENIILKKYRSQLISKELPEYCIISSIKPIRAVYVKMRNSIVALPDGVKDGDFIYDWFLNQEEAGLESIQFEILDVIDWPKKLELSFDLKKENRPHA